MDVRRGKYISQVRQEAEAGNALIRDRNEAAMKRIATAEAGLAHVAGRWDEVGACGSSGCIE